MKILIDSQEKKNFWKFECYNVNTNIQKLKTGDYILESYPDGIVIDRKRTLSEVAGNIKEKRFLRELERMQEYEEAYIICEFPYSCFFSYPENCGIPKSKWNSLRKGGKSIMMEIEQIEVKYSVPFIYCNTKEKAEDYAYQLFKNFIERKNEKVI